MLENTTLLLYNYLFHIWYSAQLDLNSFPKALNHCSVIWIIISMIIRYSIHLSVMVTTPLNFLMVTIIIIVLCDISTLFFLNSFYGIKSRNKLMRKPELQRKCQRCRDIIIMSFENAINFMYNHIIKFNIWMLNVKDI